jgi:hypothetical protein
VTRVPSLAHRARQGEDGTVKDDRRYTLTTEVEHLSAEERLRAAVRELALAVAREREPGENPHRRDDQNRPAWVRYVPSYARELFQAPHW